MPDCKDIAKSLLDCLRETDCMKAGGKAKECMTATLAPDCQVLRNTYFECKRFVADRYSTHSLTGHNSTCALASAVPSSTDISEWQSLSTSLGPREIGRSDQIPLEARSVDGDPLSRDAASVGPGPRVTAKQMCN